MICFAPASLLEMIGVHISWQAIGGLELLLVIQSLRCLIAGVIERRLLNRKCTK